ncbi:restriction endonuclease subunit S [bacterium AH-315-C08]|nr:restriction endonuclease subunit S [bacterium AH-315-C08]
MTKTIDITTAQRKVLFTLLKRFLPNTTVWVYGSRVKWTARPQSDLDMVAFVTPEQKTQFENLKEAFEESDLPFRVDLFVWDDVPEQFHKNIEAEHVVLQEKVERFLGSDPLIFGNCSKQIRQTVQPDEAKGSSYIGLEHIEQGTLHLNGFGSSDDVTSMKSLFKKGDILFGKLRPYFRKVVRAPFDGVCSTDIWVVRATDGVEQDFLYYWMASQEFVNFSMQGSEGTKMPRAKWEHVSRHPIPFFSLTEQRAIAHILGSLDDKIELNRRMNETLEAMAQTLFKSWFVDFGPVIDNALAAGNPIPEELAERSAIRESLGDARKPLPEEIQKLFPGEFEHTQKLGWVPKGWVVKPLSTIASLQTKSIQPNNEPQKVWTHFSIPSFDEGKLPKKELGKTIKSGKYIVLPTCVLASKLNPQFPRVWLPDVEDDSAPICSTEFMPFVPKDSKERPFLFAYLCSEIAQAEIVKRATGSTGSRQRVKPQEIAEMQIVQIPGKLRKTFSEICESTYIKLALNMREIHDATHCRDTLLPKLLSGELRIPEAEKLVEASV